MAIPKLNSCCCCFTIETGATIIGYLESILGCLAVIGYILVLAGVIDYGEIDGHSKDVVTISISATVVALISALIVTFGGILLLMGVYKRNPSYVKICLLLRCISIIVMVILLIVSLVSGGAFLSQSGGSLIGLALEIYWAWVIYSLFLELKGGNVNNY